jgi:hypothetical protein
MVVPHSPVFDFTQFFETIKLNQVLKDEKLAYELQSQYDSEYASELQHQYYTEELSKETLSLKDTDEAIAEPSVASVDSKLKCNALVE